MASPARFTSVLVAFLVSCSPQAVERVAIGDRGGPSADGAAKTQRSPGDVGVPGRGPDSGEHPVPEVVDGAVAEGETSREVDAAVTGSPDQAADLSVPRPPMDAAAQPPIDAAAPPPPDARLPTPPRAVVLVVKDPDVLQPGDSAVRSLIAARLPGYTIRLRDDGDPENVTSAALVVIAGSALSDTVRPKYRNAAVPVIVLESSFFDDFGLTGATPETDLGVATARSQLTIVDTAHPLAAMLTGTVPVVTMVSEMSWGTPGPSAIRIAHIPGQPARVAIFAYEKGASAPGGTLPARRVAFFAHDTPASRLSANGGRLLGAAIEWATAPN